MNKALFNTTCKRSDAGLPGARGPPSPLPPLHLTLTPSLTLTLPIPCPLLPLAQPAPSILDPPPLTPTLPRHAPDSPASPIPSRPHPSPLPTMMPQRSSSLAYPSPYHCLILTHPHPPLSPAFPLTTTNPKPTLTSPAPTPTHTSLANPAIPPSPPATRLTTSLTHHQAFISSVTQPTFTHPKSHTATHPLSPFSHSYPFHTLTLGLPESLPFPFTLPLSLHLPATPIRPSRTGWWWAGSAVGADIAGVKSPSPSRS